MDDISSIIAGLQQFWRSLIPVPWVRALAGAAIFFVFYYMLVLLIERRCGTRTANYRSRGFAHDVFYFFYFKGLLHRLIVPVTLVASLGDSLMVIQLQLLDGLAFPLQVVIWLLVADFVGYWVHRAKHHYRPLWVFHTTHHSQENVNFATYSRAHPVEDLIGQAVGFFLLLLLGATPVYWFPIYFFIDMVGELQHTQIPWKFGPLHWIIVTPPFHLYHHSRDPAHHNRNFGVLFSFWDRLFGTAVHAKSPAPTKFGLDDVRPTSLWSTFVVPFFMLYQMYWPRATAKPVAPGSYEREQEPS